MTTSITDARYTSLHFTPGAMVALHIDEPPETGWSVMPGFDQDIPVPFHLEPPRMDADETLPNMLHPSYPYGRPPTLGSLGAGGKGRNMGPGNLLGTVGMVGRDSAGLTGGGGGVGSIGVGMGMGEAGWRGVRWGDEGWAELGLEGVLEKSTKKEVPPGMAGAKRPPSPPSPGLHPDQIPPASSVHLRNHIARQRQATPPLPADAFDAPVPNETYAMEEGEEPASGGLVGLPGTTGVTGQQEGGQRQDEEDAAVGVAR